MKKRFVFGCISAFLSMTLMSCSGSEDIRKHVKENGYVNGSYCYVDTSNGGWLGIELTDETYFVVGHYFYYYSGTSSITVSSSVAFAFGEESGSGYITLKVNSVTTYQAYWECYISEHYFKNAKLQRLLVCQYSSGSDDLENVAIITESSFETAINAASAYLSGHGLPYIY